MIITVKHKETEISITERGDNLTSFKFNDQNERVRTILAAMVDKVKELNSLDTDG